MASPSVLTFDAEGRAIDFEVWVDDLQLFLQCDRADGLSLFDLTSGASPAPAADADPTVRSQGVPLPPCCPLSPLLLRPTSLVLSRSVPRLPLAGDAALARARGARARVGLVGVVEVAVGAEGGVGLAVGVVAGVEVAVATAEAEVAVAVAVGAEAAVAAEVEAAVVEEVELVGVVLLSGAAPGVRHRGGGFGPCTYVLRSGDRAGEQCGGAHPTQHCFRRLTDAWRQQFPEASEIPCWGELSRAGVVIFDLDFDAILTAMYAVTISDEGDCYRCFPPDPGIGTAALGTGEAGALGARTSAHSGAGESALSGTASASASLTFTLDSGASCSFFRDRTTLTPLGRPVAVSLADPSGGPVLSHFSTVLWCPAAPSGTLSGLYLPSFPTNLVSGADLQDTGVHQFTPASQRVTHCTDARTGRHLATFTRRPGSSLYILTTESPPVTTSGQVAASGQVFAAVSRSGPESAPCSCRLLSHETLLWHHRLGHPSLPPLQGMASRVLVPGLPRSLPPLPPGPEAPLQTLHMDVWGPAHVRGRGHGRYFLLVVDDYSRYTTLFPLRSKGDVAEVLIDWIRAARLQLRRSFGSDFPVLRLHSDRGGEFSSGLLRAYCRKVGDASAFRVWGSRAFVRDLSADKLSPRAAPCVFLGFPPDASGWHFYHPTSRRVFSSQDVTFDESVPYYRLFPYRTPSLPPPLHFLVPGPPPVDPLPPQGPAPSGVSQVDAVEPVEVTGDSGTAAGAEPGGADSGGATHVGAEPGGAASGDAATRGTEPGGAEPGGATTWGVEPGGATTGGAEPWGPSPGGAASGAAEPGGDESRATEPGGAEPAAAGPTRVVLGSAGPAGSPGYSSRREPLSPRELREWFARRWRRTTGAGASSAAEGAGAAGLGGASLASATGVGAAEGVDAEATALSSGGGPAAGATGAAGGTGAGGADYAGAAAGGTGAVPAVSGVAARPRPYFVMLLQQSSLPVLADPESDSLRAASPTVTRLLATLVTDPSFESTAASALVAELVDFAARCRLDYAASLVAESASVCPPSVGGECALGTDVLEDRQE
ncbi:unnamed protein product [Closterium sp. NIES-64]|nr:unnamed protein product [Closterium sp. NIES-64]